MLAISALIAIVKKKQEGKRGGVYMPSMDDRGEEHVAGIEGEPQVSPDRLGRLLGTTADVAQMLGVGEDQPLTPRVVAASIAAEFESRLPETPEQVTPEAASLGLARMEKLSQRLLGQHWRQALGLDESAPIEVVVDALVPRIRKRRLTDAEVRERFVLFFQGLPLGEIATRVGIQEAATIRTYFDSVGYDNPVTGEAVIVPQERKRYGGSAVHSWFTDPEAVRASNGSEALAWQGEALCAETDPEAFFPEKGGSTRDAKRICAGCSVRAECLEYALVNDERFGIWGGLSERERRKLRRAAV